MSIRCAGPHFRSDPNSFHDFFLAGTFSHGPRRMVADAVGALRYMRYRHGYELFCFFRKRAVFKTALLKLRNASTISGARTALFSEISLVASG